MSVTDGPNCDGDASDRSPEGFEAARGLRRGVEDAPLAAADATPSVLADPGGPRTMTAGGDDGCAAVAGTNALGVI